MINSIVACIGLLVSIMTFLYFKKQIAMMARKLRGEEIQQRRARLICRTEFAGHSAFEAHILNIGEGDARNIRCDFGKNEVRGLLVRGLQAFPYPYLHPQEYITIVFRRAAGETEYNRIPTFHFVFEDDHKKKNETYLTFNLR